MKWEDIVDNPRIHEALWMSWQKDGFELQQNKPKDRKQNRETLARAYLALTRLLEKEGVTPLSASARVRAAWHGEVTTTIASLPGIIRDDGFLSMYASGSPLQVKRFLQLRKKVAICSESSFYPIQIEWIPPDARFHDVDATPPGVLPKLFRYFRLQKDKELLVLIEEDLRAISRIKDSHRRELLTMAVLSHSAAYRELEGRTLQIPSFTEPGYCIPYLCHQHLIAEGAKTITLVPQKAGAASIYLCQGTELWPSQPSVVGSIMTNFAAHGSATEAYAHSWRRIHKHLRELPGTPIVAGHSMGGALAQQIGLYSHNLVQKIYAFNPPAPHERDYLFYHQLSGASQRKIQVIANLDDFAFWRMGSKLIGNITLFMGKTRWRYYPVGLWDCLLFVPAFVKFILNVQHAFPAHQHIVALHENWVSVKLTQVEIDRENRERVGRFDYLRFLPKLYDPTKNLLRYLRAIFRWKLEKDYLRNEIELISLHERDLIDTLNEANKEEIQHELKTLQVQKSALISRLLRKTK
jgi:pimeloyl-ACP methyl ester carboxylesterase